MNESIFWDRMTERMDETITALKTGRAPRIVRYAIHITSCCNLNCLYCKESKTGKIMPRNFFIDLCYKAGKDGIAHITGGEPMIVEWLESELQNLKGVTRFALNTNLTMLPQVKTLESVFRVKTSLDNYRLNNIPVIIRNIKEVSQQVKYTSVCYTVTHDNVSVVAEFIDFAQKEFPDIYSLAFSFYKGNQDNLILTESDIKTIFHDAKKLNGISYQVFMETHAPQGNYFPTNLTIPCYLSLSERLYDENCDEYFCSHLFRDKVKPPGSPGKDLHCVTGCNAKFNTYNKILHEQLSMLIPMGVRE